MSRTRRLLAAKCRTIANVVLLGVILCSRLFELYVVILLHFMSGREIVVDFLWRRCWSFQTCCNASCNVSRPTCLSHTSSLFKYVAHHSIRFGLNFSLIDSNVLYCSRRYRFDVSDVLTNNSRFISDTIHSCATVRGLKLYWSSDACGWFVWVCTYQRWSGSTALLVYPKSDVQTTVNMHCVTVGCFYMFFFCFFLLFLCFCIICRVPW